MRKFDIAVLSPSTDTAKVMETIGARMASLAVDRMAWGRIIAAAGMQQLKYSEPGAVGSLAEELAFLAKEAVPEEGDPHPQRAVVTLEGDGLVTPGGVTVQFSRTNILVDFGRDSNFLAASILAALAEARGEKKIFALGGVVAGDFGPETAHLMF